ncbi:MAG: hypothetical protein KTR30_33505 [Saprospiraceae bacterium]|nr:hypothetical protein [Saprospiraceae bacterium]
MEDAYLLVEYFLIFMGLIFVLFEIVLNLMDIGGETTNVFLYRWSKGKFFFIPFALGAIMGHLFLGTKRAIFETEIIQGVDNDLLSVLVLVGLALIMVLIGHLISFSKSKLFLSVLLILGLLYGHFFWSMNVVLEAS